MAKSVLSKEAFERLTSSIEWSDRMIAFQREKRVDNVRQLCGFHHTKDGSHKRLPLNFIKLATSVYLRQLAARAPTAFVTAEQRELRPTAANFELSLNQIPKEVGLQQTLRDTALEAMFGVGIVKCGLHRVGTLLNHDYGELFLDLITIDDLVLDMSAKRWDQIQYIGNSYWVDYKELMEGSWIGDDEKKDLKAEEYTIIGDQGETRAEDVQINETAVLFRPKIQLRDVFLPVEQLVVTYAVKQKKKLKEIKWTGPASGPYIKLGFDEVPGNLLPIAPVNVWRDIHDIANVLIRKLSKQADDQKNVPAFGGGNDESAQEFKAANDGDGIAYTGNPPQMLSIPGPDASTLGFFMQVREIASWVGGNIDLLGGLGSQSETLGQDRLLNESASAQLRDMTSKIIDFSKAIFEQFAYYDWHDPVKRRRITKTVPGSTMGVEMFWERGMKKGKLKDYLVGVDVYSLQDNSPSVKMQKLVLFIERIITPLMPAVEAQRGKLDVQTIIRHAAEFSDFPEGKDLVVWDNEEADPASGSGGHERTMPAHTTRTNERINHGGGTKQGNNRVLAQMLAGQGGQNGNSNN